MPIESQLHAQEMIYVKIISYKNYLGQKQTRFHQIFP